MLDFYAVSRRRELDISIINAAFYLEINENEIVKKARLVYGGIAEITKRAAKAEKALIGNKIRIDKDFCRLLEDEFSPISDVRADASFRKAQISQLWLKFANKIFSKTQQEALDFSISNFSKNQSKISQTLQHENAEFHANGKALYTQDIACKRSALVAYPILSNKTNGKIIKFDYKKAEGSEGIVKILTNKDIKGINDIGHFIHDERMLSVKNIFYHSQLMGVIIGKNLESCKKAAQLVEIEIEEKEPILSIQHAIKEGSFHGQEHVIARGDTKIAFKKSTHILEDVFEFGGQEHFYLETQTAWAEMREKDSIFVMSSTQHPSEVQTIVGQILNIDRNKITVEVPFLGGGFGGKETQGNLWAAICSLGAFITKKPVQIQLDRDHDMQITGKRHPFLAKYKVGFDSKGILQSAEIELIANGGWSIDLSQPVVDRALFHLDNAYYIKNVKFTGKIAKTNICSQTAFRGFGGPQGMLVIEEIIGQISQFLKIPAEEIRKRNFYRGKAQKNITHYGEFIENNRLEKIWQLALKKANFKQRKEKIEKFNQKSKHIKRAISITPVKFGVSFTLKHFNQAGSLVLVYADGSVQINHGGIEMGQGLHTKILGVAMDCLGLPEKNFRIMNTRTDKVPNTSATAASVGSDINGAAVKKACLEIKRRLIKIFKKEFNINTKNHITFKNGIVFAKNAPNKSIKFKELTKIAYQNRVNLSAFGFYKTPGLNWNWLENKKIDAKGKPFHYFAFGSAVSEVEIDGFTGDLKILRVDIVHDVGNSLNHKMDRGQIEGAFVQGMGWLTSEELKWNEHGKLLTHSASTYAIPAIGNAPAEFNVTFLPNARQKKTVGGSKAVGEPPFMLAISVREAIKEAVSAFKTTNNQKLIKLNSPATGEAIFKSIQEINHLN